MTFASLECDRLSVELALATCDGREHALERDLRAALDGQLAQALAPFATARDDGTRLFIDRLVVDGAVGGAWDLDAIVHTVARRIATALSAGIDAGVGITFRDRAEFIAAFIVALADGSAWRRWWFEEFDGLKVLSASNAIRSVVLLEGETGIAALARLTSETARRVIESMTPADAARVLAAVRARVATSRTDVALPWAVSATLERAIEADPRRWLAALVECERAKPGSAGEEAVTVLASMRALREICAVHAFGPVPPGTDLRAALRTHANRFGLAVAWLDGMPETALRPLADGLAADTAARPVAATCWTEHGGIFLLMPLIVRLGWPAVWRDALGDAGARTLALALAVHALAPRRARHLLADAALLRALDVREVHEFLGKNRRGCERALSRLELPAVRARGNGALVGGRLGAALLGAGIALLSELGARLPGLAGSSPDYLRRNILALPAAVAVHAAGARIRVGRAPLDVLLTLSGCKRGRCELPGEWTLELDGEVAA